MQNFKKNIKRQSIIQLFLSIAILLLVNIISSYIFTRCDLTKEKRFTLTPATKHLLKNLDDVVFYKVYLEGDFPSGFKRLHNATKEMLDEFRAYSSNIEYAFINPSESKDAKTRNITYEQLVNKGLLPTNLQVKSDDGSSQQIIFPGALVTFKGREVPVQLLNTQIGIHPEAILNNSIQALEFNLSDAIRKLNTGIKPKIAFIEGHDELKKIEVADITNAIGEYYEVERITIDGQINSLTEHNISDSSNVSIHNKYKAIIIAKPLTSFTEKDKFIIDQYIMRGGKVLWLLDPIYATMDSLKSNNQTIGIANNINLDDMLFKYGVRVNVDLILDINALPIPVVTGYTGTQPQQSFFPWHFFPVLMPTSNHPIVNNLNAIKTEFASSIDFVGTDDNIKKTILLTSSKYTRTLGAPIIINLETLRKEPDQRQFNKSFVPVAVLLEGEFISVFRNRLPGEIQNRQEFGFKEISSPTTMIVVGDGDIIKNELHYSKGYPLPLGYDQYTGQQFGNKEFILNAIDYLCDDSGLLNARSRELKLRLLDRTKINNTKAYWQLFNIATPILIILIFGIIQFFVRKKKYSKNRKMTL